MCIYIYTYLPIPKLMDFIDNNYETILIWYYAKMSFCQRSILHCLFTIKNSRQPPNTVDLEISLSYLYELHIVDESKHYVQSQEDIKENAIFTK